MTGRVYRYLRGTRPDTIDRDCPRCGAVPEERCLDLRSINRRTLRPHPERTTR